jgi:hypothetical protein
VTVHWKKLRDLCEEIARHLPGEWALDSHTWEILLTRRDYYLRLVIDDKVNITADINLLSENDTTTRHFTTRLRDGRKIAEFLTRKLKLHLGDPGRPDHSETHYPLGYMQGRGAS